VGRIDALLDIGALLVVCDQHGTAFVIKPVIGSVVSNTSDGVARYLLKIDHCVGGDLSSHHHQAGVNHGFRGYARSTVMS